MKAAFKKNRFALSLSNKVVGLFYFFFKFVGIDEVQCSMADI